LLGACICHLTTHAKTSLVAPWPDIVIACGRRSEPVARWIKQQNPNTKLVYLMTPASPKHWDLIVAPAHDVPAPAGNITTTLGPLHSITRHALADAAAAWVNAPGSPFTKLPKPRIGVMIGGAPAGGTFDTGDALAMLREAERLAAGGSLLITTSRRTPASFRGDAAATLIKPYYWYDWSMGGANPYLAILALSDALVVSGDSLSMCAEAAGTSKPLFIHQPPKLPLKHRSMHETLIARGSAQLLDATSQIHPAQVAPLNEAERVAEEIRTRFL
jgi:mitochondrial fission protein ELM1